MPLKIMCSETRALVMVKGKKMESFLFKVTCLSVHIIQALMISGVKK
jgi:hypothetical protein